MFDFLDEHLFVFCLLVTVGMQLSFFGVAYTCQFDKVIVLPAKRLQTRPPMASLTLVPHQVTDFAGGTNFTLLAVLTLVLTDTYYTRQLLVTGMVALSRTELALYLLVRVLQRGKDSRFDEMRQKFFVRTMWGAHPCPSPSRLRQAFLGFWVFQIVWVRTGIVAAVCLCSVNVSLPMCVLNAGVRCECVRHFRQHHHHLQPGAGGPGLRRRGHVWCVACARQYLPGV